MGLIRSISDPHIAKHLLRDEGEVIVDEVKHHWMAYLLAIAEVLGAIALLGPEMEGDRLRTREGTVATAVRFRELAEAEIAAYLASGEWRGRAGAYAVQGLGSALVDEVRGDVSNVIGLPVPLLLELAPELLPGAAAFRAP